MIDKEKYGPMPRTPANLIQRIFSKILTEVDLKAIWEKVLMSP
jgi:hypothetical protein